MTTAEAGTVAEVLGEQARQAEQTRNDEAKDMSNFSPGDCMPQGDLYFVGLKSAPRNLKHRKDRQLADGNTQGSRHIHEGGELFDGDAEELSALVNEATGGQTTAKYIGPVFFGGSVVHPEHGDHLNYPAEVPCVTVYQKNLNREELEERVAD